MCQYHARDFTVGIFAIILKTGYFCNYFAKTGHFCVFTQGFTHKTICHARRFSRYEINGTMVTRVTTNHIERMWVELRRSLKFMDRENFLPYIDLESFRQMFMNHVNPRQNVLTMLKDFAKFGKQ